MPWRKLPPKVKTAARKLQDLGYDIEVWRNVYWNEKLKWKSQVRTRWTRTTEWVIYAYVDGLRQGSVTWGERERKFTPHATERTKRYIRDRYRTYEVKGRRGVTERWIDSTYWSGGRAGEYGEDERGLMMRGPTTFLEDIGWKGQTHISPSAKE